MPLIKAESALASLRQFEAERVWIDVRSEKEFQRASLPGSRNGPILYQSERHEVGLAYKHEGPVAAFRVGERLVGPHQQERVAAWSRWIEASPAREAILFCWRGGLRSALASQWLESSGQKILRVEGGYKALRTRLLQHIEEAPPLLVICGLTGSGKTELLQEFTEAAIDLEAAAYHRGSSFGAWLERPEATQASFENALGWQLASIKELKRPLLVEDESRLLGRCVIPETFFQLMRQASIIILEESLEARAMRLAQEYLLRPLARGIPLEAIQARAEESLQPLLRRLDRHAVSIQTAMQEAFRLGPRLEAHSAWISQLLIHYYDKRYQHAFARQQRKLLFQGPAADCREWLIERGYQAFSGVSGCKAKI